MARLTIDKLSKPDLDRVADGLVAAIAASLPWSTTATSILIALWLIVALPRYAWVGIRSDFRTPAGGSAVLLWLVAVVGMLWADVSLSERFLGLGGYNKLMAIPLLLTQFSRTERVHWVIIAFLAASIVLVAVSWFPVFYPRFAEAIWRKWEGVPVKTYITQSDVFQLCAFGLVYAAVDAWRGAHKTQALLFVALSALFFGNLGYVVISRTGIIVMPILILLIAYRLFHWRGLFIAGLMAIVLSGIAWTFADSLHTRLRGLIDQITATSDTNITSVEFRAEFIRKALGIIADAPVIGHGTGTIRESFEKSSEGESGIAALVTTNPHQQTLAVAIQLGIVGIVLLWAMWIAHMLLFRRPGMIESFGLLVVTQNVVSCLINSHIFDFTEGWIYVIGVGALGGAALRRITAMHPG